MFTLRAAVLGFLYLSFGILCTQLPLFRTFGYEFAVLSGLLVALTAGPFAITSLRALPVVQAGPGAEGSPFKAHVAAVVRIAAAVWLLLLVPMCLLLANAWFVPNCAPLEGTAFWLLIPCITAAFSAALAALCMQVFRSSLAHAMYAVVILLLLLHPVAQIYSQPQLYAYNHLFGLFVGFSWDEARPPLATLLLYRLLSIAYCVVLVQVSYVLSPVGREHRGGKFRAGFFASFAVAALVIGAGFAASDHLGFSNSAAYARTRLGAVRHTAHCSIVYDSSRVTQAEIARIADEHEFRLQQVATALGVPPAGHITTYLYPDAATKRRLVGTESSQVARPWTREIHLSMAGWSDALKHELVHVSAAAFGPAPFGAPVFRCLGLTEGLAMAVEWTREGRTPHELAAGMLAQNLLPTARACISTEGFLSGSSSAGYIASGSFTRWLMDTRGRDVVRRAYAMDDVEAATGSTYEQLDHEWRVFLRSVPRVQPDFEAIRYTFLRPPLARKICPRAVTEVNRRARAAFRAGEWARADSLYRVSDALAPNASAVFGRALTLLQRGRDAELLAWTESLLTDSTRVHTLLPVRIWRAFAAWRCGDSARADHEVSRVAAAELGGWAAEDAHRLRVALRSPASRDPLIRCLVRARGAALDNTSERRRDSLDLLHAVAADPAGNLARLLFAERYDIHARTLALSLLVDARAGDFRVDCLRRAAMYRYEDGEYRDALALLRTALTTEPTLAERELVEDDIARCNWKLSAAPRLSSSRAK